MQRKLFTIIAIGTLGAVLLTGCTQKAASSKEAIQKAKKLVTVEEQIDYLVKQANTFINREEFNQAINTAQYVLSKLDSKSEGAQKALEKAKNKIADAAQKTMDKKMRKGSIK